MTEQGTSRRRFLTGAAGLGVAAGVGVGVGVATGYGIRAATEANAASTDPGSTDPDAQANAKDGGN